MLPLPLGAPALPLDEAGKYVAAAYIVFVVLLVAYLAIMAVKVQRIERDLRELASFAENRQDPGMPGRDAEDMPGSGSSQPPTDSDRNLTPSETVGGPGAAARGDQDV